MALKKWTITLHIEVSDNWIQDGANPSNWTKEIEEVIQSNFLTYAFENEFMVKATVSNQPHKDVIDKVMNS